MILPPESLLLLVVVLIVTILTLLHHARAVSMQQAPRRRPLRALEPIGSALARGAETGKAIHLSPGSGSIGGRGSTVETVAGLLAAASVAGEAALTGAPLLTSSGDAVAHLALRGALRQAYQRAGMGQDYDPANVQMLAHQDPTAYALGMTTLYGRQKLEASQLIGSFGQEVLLATENGAQQNVPQVGGATTTTALPLLYLSTDATLIGEEIYAAEAYLSRSTAPHARLLTIDTLRTVIIIAIVVMMALAAAGFQLPL